MLGTELTIGDYLGRTCQVFAEMDLAPIERLSARILSTIEKSHFIFVFGNGGSGATAAHLAEDLGKNALREADLHLDTKKRPRVISLADNTSWITALGNDVGFDQVFLQQLMQYAAPGDLVVALSGSGNSPNILAAVEWARRRGLVTFGLTGFDGGMLKKIQDDGLHVPIDDMGIVESVHLTVCHWLVDDVHARLNRTGRYA